MNLAYSLEKFKELIIEGKYFEAHEVLEEEWHKIRKSDNDLKWALKGLINAAVAMELKKRKRVRFFVAWRNFEKYEKYYLLDENIKLLAEFVKKYKP
jgi:predicted metal-dependent hydrolase